MTSPAAGLSELERLRAAVTHAVWLLRWWADDASDEDDILEMIQQSTEVANELEATVGAVGR